MNNRTLAGALAALLVSIPAVAADQPWPTATYHYFKQPRALPIDVARIAVFDASGAAINAADASVHPGGRNGWFFIDLPATSRTEAGVRATVADPSRLAAVQPVAQRGGKPLFAAPVFIGEAGGPVFPQAEILLRFESGVPAAFAEQVIAQAGIGDIVERNLGGMSNAYRIRTSRADGFAVLDDSNLMAQSPLVRFAEPNMIFTGRGDLIPNDPLFSNCWGLRNTGQTGGTFDADMDVSEAWDITTGIPSVIVVVLDVGVQQDHPDINQIPGADFTGAGGGGGPVNSCEKHGTAVAGCVTGMINNGIGAVGVAPGCKVASAHPFTGNTSSCDGSWSGSATGTIDALNWAIQIGARVTNNSNQYGFTSSGISDAYQNGRSAGIVHFASAGNSATSPPVYPASIPVVNAVAALNSSGNRASFSNYGPGLDFSAPGQGIQTTDRTGTAGYSSTDYAVVDGTSFASPYAAGVAALIISNNPALTPFQVEALMQSGSVDMGTPGYDTDTGWGFLNAYQSLTGTAPPPPPPPGTFSLASPADGATGISLSTTLDWSDSSGATAYTVTLDDNADFSSPVFSILVNQSTLTLSPGTLSSATTYWWKVVARNDELVTTASTPGAAHFTTLVPPPPCRADLDHNGKVDTIDLGIMLSAYGHPTTPGTGADITGDGLVNTLDLGIVLNEYGRTNCP